MDDHSPPKEKPDNNVPDAVGPYRFRRQLGTGGMGEVFLADDERLNRKVAIKRIRSDRLLTAEIRERLYREARYAASLDHPAIVRVHDVLERGGAFYLVMEWVAGEDLRRRLQREGPMAPPDVIALAHPLASGLAAAHAQGIVHRDFKSENVLIGGDGQPKITDFGIAKRMTAAGDGDAKKDESLTDSGTVLGTYRVLSPEQVLGDEIDPRSDLFSFGVLLFEALSGRSPFGESNSLETLHRIVENEPAPLICPHPEPLPLALKDLVMGLLSKDLNARPQSAREVEWTLATLLPKGAAAEIPSPLNSAPKTPDGLSKAKLGALVFGLLAAILVVILGLAYFA
ncbi:MAG: serine/threonine-protein kinase [Acidobacteriota bacterium]